MFFLLIYKIFLDVVFYAVINPVFSGEVYFSNFEGFKVGNFVLSYLLLGLCYLLIKGSVGRVSGFFLRFQVVVFIVPYLVLFGQLNYQLFFLVPIFVGYLSLFLFVFFLPSIRVRPISDRSRTILILVLIVVAWYLIVRLFFAVGYGNINFNLRNVYDFREGFSGINFLGSGFISGIAYVVNVGLMIYFVQVGLKERKAVFLILAALVFGSQVLIFGLTNFKAYLFILPAALGVVFLMRFTQNIEKLLISGVVIAVSILVALGYYTDLYSTSMVRRAFFVPPGLTALYYEYFSVNEFSGLNIINKLMGESVEELDNIRQIAYYYWGRGFSPNVEWIADAYTKLGLVYVIVNALVLALILKVGDFICANFTVERGVAEALMLGPCISLSSAGLITAIVSHGLLLVVPVLWALSVKDNEYGG